MVLKEIQEHKVMMVLKVMTEPQVHKEQQDLKVHRVQQVTKGLKV